MPVGWAIAGGALIGAAGNIIGSNTQAGAQEQAAQTQWNMFNQINQQEQPFIQGGYGALNEILYGMGLGPTWGGAQPAGGGAAQAPGWAVPGFGGPTAGGDNGVGGPGYGYPGGLMPTPGGGVSQRLTNGPSGMVGPGTQIAGGGVAPRAGGPPPGAGGPGGIGFGQFTSGFTPQDFLNNLDPGYGFQLQTGAQALRNADTPGMGALSGAALKDLMSFNQGMAATGYQNAYNRWNTTNQNIFSRLSGIAGLGQNAATQVGTSGTSLGTGIAQAQAAAGGSLAGGIVGATGSVGNSIPLAYLMQGQGGSPGYVSGSGGTNLFAGDTPGNYSNVGGGAMPGPGT